MKKKNALAFWYNLKGNYDIVVFDNKRNLNKYLKAYKELYTKMENEEISFEEFSAFVDTLNQSFWDNVIKQETEIFYKEIKDNEFVCYIDNEKTKIDIVEKLDYGV